METVLVVEDEALVGLEIKESLEKMGYSVPPVISSGDKVVEAVLQYKPSLIIMDINLKSFIDGIDAAQRIKIVGKVPVIYLTAYSNEDVKNRALRTAPVAYLLKPLAEDELQEAVEQALASA